MLAISFATLKFEMLIDWKWMICVNLCISFEADSYKIQINRYINDYIIQLCIERTPYCLIHFVAAVVIVDFTDMHRTPYLLLFLWSPHLLLEQCYLKRIFHIIIHAYYALCLAAAVAAVPYFCMFLMYLLCNFCVVRPPQKILCALKIKEKHHQNIKFYSLYKHIRSASIETVEKWWQNVKVWMKNSWNCMLRHICSGYCVKYLVHVNMYGYVCA